MKDESLLKAHLFFLTNEDQTDVEYDRKLLKNFGNF